MTFTPHEVALYYSSRVPALKPISKADHRAPCPIHNGKDLNFSVNPENGLCRCYSQCGRGWDMISIEQELTGLDFIRAKERVFELVGRPKVPWEERNVQAIYDYTDGNGKLLYQVLRLVGKEFKQRRPAGNGGWTWSLGDVERVPFRLPKVNNAQFIAIPEGERDVITLETLGMTASCNNGGAGNFKPELARHFAKKDIAIFPDNDEPGQQHALKVATILASVARSVKIVEIPGLPLKGDVSDFAAGGGTIDQLRDLYKAAQPWTVDWRFGSNLPNENDKFVRSFEEEVEVAGGLMEFWNLSRLEGLETPWPKVSRALGGGMRNGEVYILGANQGAGKTSMALQFAIAAIRRRESVLMFSMEMAWRAIFQRMAAIEAHVDLNELRGAQIAVRRQRLGQEDVSIDKVRASELLRELARTSGDLVQYPMLVSTRAAVTPEYIVMETARLGKRSKIQLVIVDHMQLMGGDGNGSGRSEYERFTAISRAMKQVAVDIGCPVLLVSQTSRTQSKEHRGELEVSDLRGTGALEEDAAGVMLLYEDKADREAAKTEGDGSRYTKGPVRCYLKLGKNRYGEQERCFEFTHYKASTRFEGP